MSTNMLNPRRGFTLLELVTVATILGIMAAILTPRLLAPPAEAIESDEYLEQLNALVERYEQDNGDWPTSLNDLVSDGYLDKVPTHPEESHHYALDDSSHRVEAVFAD